MNSMPICSSLPLNDKRGDGIQIEMKTTLHVHVLLWEWAL